MFLFFDQDPGTVQRHTAVVTDDTSAAVGIRQPRNDGRTARSHHLVRISRENTFVVRLSVFGEDFLCHRVQMIAIGFQAVFDHADTTFREDTAFQRGVCLQPDDHLVFLIDITGPVCIDSLGKFCFGIIYPFFPFHLKHFGQFVPHFLRFLRRGYEESIVSFVRFVIVLDKISYIDLFFPGFTFELLPVLIFKHHKLILSNSV